MLITFSGVDGSGKTTQARYVCDLLRSYGYAIELIHFISWTWVNQLGQILIRKQENPKKSAINKKRPGLLHVIIRIGLMGLDLARFKVLLIFTQRSDKVLVCDRYFYDLGIQARYIRVMPAWLLIVYWWFVPRPDHAFFLDVSPVLAEQREGEHTSKYYYEKQALYQSESFYWPVVKVSADSLEPAKGIITAQLKNLKKSH